MGRNRMTITDYLSATEEPVDELWHQALMDEWAQMLEELGPDLGEVDESDV